MMAVFRFLRIFRGVKLGLLILHCERGKKAMRVIRNIVNKGGNTPDIVPLAYSAVLW